MAAETDKQDPKDQIEEATRKGSAAAFYAAGVPDREPYLTRARRVAELTIPTLFRSEGSSGADDQIIPWNSIGAYCVNNLASKVVFALFPAGRPNFKAEQDKRTAQDLEAMPEDEKAQVQAIIRTGLSKLEQDVATAIEEDGDRARMFTAALRLLIGGNHGFQFYDDGTIRGIPLERTVMVRDPQGNILEWAIEDALDWETLPDDVREAYLASGAPEPSKPANGKRPVKVYTHGHLMGGKWHIRQEVMGMDVEGSRAVYRKDASPYLFLPWILLEGEDYGRSYVEFYEGDLLTAESLTKTVGEGSAALARFLMLVNPVGQTDKKAVARAKNGDVITGREQDVVVVTSQKSADFSVAKSEKDDAIERLSRAFLLNSSVQRGGERVTAEEIRYVAQELEDALGGVYSQQIVTWQAPYVRLKIKYLQKERRVAKLPEGTVKITVTAGLAALARNAELTGLRTYAQIMAEAYGPQSLPRYLKPDEFANRVAAALGVDPVGLVPTKEELAQEDQQAQMMGLVDKLGPEAMRQLGQNITSNQVAQTNAEAKAQAPQPAPQQ